MICGLCNSKGTRPNKGGLWCNCDRSGRKRIHFSDPACEEFDLDQATLEKIQAASQTELENMELWNLVLGQMPALTSAERVVLFHMRISQNIKRLLDLVDRIQVYEGTYLLTGPVADLRKAHRDLRAKLKETDMEYPTPDEVEKADRVQLARWSRYLNSPGSSAVGTPEFPERLDNETKVLDRILERFEEQGGMTPEISKEIGW